MKCLLLGGGGPVGVAVQYLFKQMGWTAWVVDPCRPQCFAAHRDALAGTVLRWLPQKLTLDGLEACLREERFDVVLDLTPTLDKRQSFALCDRLGVPLINSTMVDYKDDIHIAAYNFLDDRPQATRCPHVAASGMNPGAISAMAEEIIAQQGPPDAIVYWEYDDTQPADGVFRGPSTTWCQTDSHAEITDDWCFEVLEEGTVLLHEDALDWPGIHFRHCGIPFDVLPIPPDGEAFLVGHEECLYMGWRHDTAAKFIYGFHPENMKLIRAAGYEGKVELLLCQPQRPLRGGDIVGVSCRYDAQGQWHGRYCRMSNTPEIPPDTNATCWLVGCGLVAGAAVLGQRQLPPGVYLTHEIPGYLAAFRSLTTVHSCVVGATNGYEHEPGELSAVRAEQPRRTIRLPEPAADRQG